ncbi:hypothetical protein NDU88_000370 [Pleurodeles waltl]|uniref:Ig-like domain-containing protein n=1 Tax=Pleurodeles waltl TaxID=8319 RepID=A0AAV7P3J8_PLEWA|nr:hypothetical protein NDU88_000370 [Pleurodeles waltl]
MEHVSLSIIFFALLSYTISQRIVQTPRSLVKPAGAPAELLCTVEGVSTPYMYWYKLQPTQPLTLVSYSVTTQSVDENYLPHFTAVRPTGQAFNLKTERLDANDTAVYYCAWSHTPREVGEGA